ncbi:hypothetical protein PMAYCL1PPCAC_15985 [Pristionchus mayeri]|uniref:N-acyl-aliphatic-L-amino acid amidohydrolase n=1 Tax=Pristionchus mayeri TaxID=1317129 RepID=A0AAN5CK16_9BILA|nr:hypothetical protein PMAYCL1PPCAC_15985 [Pristionchus mayeri]
MSEDIAVTKFREYLRVNTEQPKPDYHACQKFLYSLADELGITRTSHEMVPGKPIVIMTIPGVEPSLPSLIFYSHTDVVPTFKEHWTYDPCSAHKDEHGRIFARGAQDMKCVGSQYFEAIRRHFLRGKRQFRRTVHLVWGPDEEIGGRDGMGKFVDTDEFRTLNVGFALDEGLASENEARAGKFWRKCANLGLQAFEVIFTGGTGHASKFVENTAIEKLHKFMDCALAFRAKQKANLDGNPDLHDGDVTTLNITVIEGGVQTNVVPEKIVIKVDCRVALTEDFYELEKRIRGWCEDDGVTLQFRSKSTMRIVTPTTRDDPWWAALEDVLDEEGCPFTKEIFPAGTDSRYLRAKGLKAIGFSPMINTPSLLHDHNEYISESTFLRGVEIYEKLIERLADLA